MFTGIVTEVATVRSARPRKDIKLLIVEMNAVGPLPDIGSSIMLSGVCLTVTQARDQSGRREVGFDLGPETLAATTAGRWESGTRVNIERALAIGDELGGHLVSGHIDGVATIVERRNEGETVAFGFAAPQELARFIAVKGSVALDGTSLTVNTVEGAIFSCHLVPHTLSVTTWGDRAVGDEVNLEVDQLARYVDRLAAFR